MAIDPQVLAMMQPEGQIDPAMLQQLMQTEADPYPSQMPNFDPSQQQQDPITETQMLILQVMQSTLNRQNELDAQILANSVNILASAFKTLSDASQTPQGIGPEAELMLKQQELEFNQRLKQQELEAKIQLQAEAQASKIELERAKLELEAQAKSAELALDADAKASDLQLKQAQASQQAELNAAKVSSEIAIKQSQARQAKDKKTSDDN